MTATPSDPTQDSSASQQTGDEHDAAAALDQLTTDLASARQEMDRLRDIAARSQADLQNAKERLQRESTDIRSYAAAGVVEKLLPTVDNFRRAFRHLPEELATHEWVKGVQAVEQDLIRRLEEAGLKRMECKGQQVDPHKHEVLQAAPGAADVILEVFEDGYEFNGRVLRPAKVKVGDGSEEN